MSKKNRRQRQQPLLPSGARMVSGPVRSSSFMVPLESLGLEPVRPRYRWAHLWENLSRQIGPGQQFAAIWFAATAAGACCDEQHEPEAVIVSLPSEAVLGMYRSLGAGPSYNPVGITVYDGLVSQSHLMALLDIEDAKQLVNRLSEAIAAAETRAALGRASRAKGDGDAR